MSISDFGFADGAFDFAEVVVALPEVFGVAEGVFDVEEADSFVSSPVPIAELSFKLGSSPSSIGWM